MQMTEEARKNGGGIVAVLIMAGIMIGAGLGAAFGNVAIGIPAGLAVGGLASMLVLARRR